MLMVHSGIPNGIPECTINIDKLGSVSWRAWRWLKRVETCRPKIVFYVINCCVLTDILYYVCINKWHNITNLQAQGCTQAHPEYPVQTYGLKATAWTVSSPRVTNLVFLLLIHHIVSTFSYCNNILITFYPHSLIAIMYYHILSTFSYCNNILSHCIHILLLQ